MITIESVRFIFFLADIGQISDIRIRRRDRALVEPPISTERSPSDVTTHRRWKSWDSICTTGCVISWHLEILCKAKIGSSLVGYEPAASCDFWQISPKMKITPNGKPMSSKLEKRNLSRLRESPIVHLHGEGIYASIMCGICCQTSPLDKVKACRSAC